MLNQTIIIGIIAIGKMGILATFLLVKFLKATLLTFNMRP